MNIEAGLLITTVIMALGAITFSALTMAFQRSHSRKSVRPFCNIHKCTTETVISVGIQNAGMGPMLIQNIVLLKNQDDPIQRGISLAQAFPSGISPSMSGPETDGYVLAPLGEMQLLYYSSDMPEQKEVSILRERFNGYFLYIKYADVYDDSYEKKCLLF